MSLYSAVFEQRDRRFLWLPAILALGIGLYFALPKEPPLGAALLPLPILAALWWKRRREGVWLLFLCLLVAMAGFTAAQWRTVNVESPFLQETIRYTNMRGTIAEILPKPRGMKLVLTAPQIEKLSADETPRKISVTLRKPDERLKVGDVIALRGGLFPPPTPAMPGGFDFSRMFFFKGIGAVGYALPGVEIIDSTPPSEFESWLAQKRHDISTELRRLLGEAAGSVVTGFITGETSSLPKEVEEAMQTAGLYHLLAVSGMNLALVSGIVFFVARFILVLLPLPHLRLHAKKYAAALALITSYLYLRLAGAPVSAERAFVMIALLFGAIIVDRAPTTMRSLAVAALLILLFLPESLMSAGFHLSFAATLGLIAFYESYGDVFYPPETRRGILKRTLFYLFGVLATTLVAGLATMPFIIYHFNQFYSYSLLANLLVIPIVTFWVTPLALFAFVLMPFGLDEPLWQAVGWGVEWMLSITQWIASLPQAQVMLPSLSVSGLLLVSLGGLWLCFWLGRVRLLGLIPIALGIATISLHAPPDILISDDGQQMAIRGDDGTLALLKGRHSNFAVEQWWRAEGETIPEKKQKLPENITCDAIGCLYRKAGHEIAFVWDRNAFYEECEQAELVISPLAAPKQCDAATIDKWTLKDTGAQAIWLSEGVRIVSTVDIQKRRPWSRYYFR